MSLIVLKLTNKNNGENFYFIAQKYISYQMQNKIVNSTYIQRRLKIKNYLIKFFQNQGCKWKKDIKLIKVLTLAKWK